MASPSERFRNNVRAGIFVSVTIVAGIAAIIFFTNAWRSITVTTREYQVTFNVAEGVKNLKKGADVRVGGVTLGQVKEVSPRFAEPFTVIDEFGASTLIEFGEDQPGTLLLAFNLDCAACDEVFPIWNEVIPVENSNALRVLPINLGPPDSHSDGESHALPVQAFSISPDDLEPFRKIPRIPATLLLSNKGVVEHAWTGVPSPAEENAFREAVAAYARSSE